MLLLIAIISAVFASATVYSQGAVQSDADSAKKILIVGDSLSAAYKLSSDDGWPYLLQQRIRQQRRNYLVVNASVSGATTAAGLQILPKALSEHKPDIVVIELGGNDGLQGKPVPYIKRNLEKLIVLAQSSGARVLLTGMRLPPNFGSRYTQPFYAQYGVLAERYDLAFVPFLLDKVAGHPGMMLDDGIHPSAAGQPVVLENVWPVLELMLD